MSDTTANRTGALSDPFRNFNFRLTIANREDIYFTDCSGLSVRVHTIRYREGGLRQRVRALPGAVEYGDVVLRYGLTASNSDFFWTWLTATLEGRDDRRPVSIVALGHDGETEGRRWNLVRAFPSEWSGAAFDAMGRDVAIEQLRLSFDEITRG